MKKLRINYLLSAASTFATLRKSREKESKSQSICQLNKFMMSNMICIKGG